MRTQLATHVGLAIGIVALWSSSSPAFAARSIPHMPPHTLELCGPILEPPTLRKSAELEMDVTPKTLAWITTTNGLLSGLFFDQSIPRWFQVWANRHREVLPPFERLEDLPWDALANFPNTQKELVATATSERDQEFFIDRAVHGMVTRKEIVLDFPRAITLFGRRYEKGLQRVDLSHVLLPKVEFRSAGAMDAFSGIELHLSAVTHSGQMAIDAWGLQSLAGIPRKHLHVHSPSPIPLAKIRENRKFEIPYRLDLMRRAETFTHMNQMFDSSKGVHTRSDPGTNVVYFSHMHPEDLHIIADYLDGEASRVPGRGSARARRKSSRARTHDRLAAKAKVMGIGIRGASTYEVSDVDGESGGEAPLMGREYRTLRKTTDKLNARTSLNAMDRRFESDDSGIDRERFARWLGVSELAPDLVRDELDVDIESGVQKVVDAYYLQEWPVLFEKLPEPLREIVTPARRRHLIALVGSEEQAHEELRMILFNWSNDPLLFDEPVPLAKVLSAQEIAIRELLRLPTGREASKTGILRMESDSPAEPFDELRAAEVFRRFMSDSGLYELYARSLGMRLVPR